LRRVKHRLPDCTDTIYQKEKWARGGGALAYDHTARSKLDISIITNNQANPRRKKYGDNNAPMKSETADVNARRPRMLYIRKLWLIIQMRVRKVLTAKYLPECLESQAHLRKGVAA